MLIATAGKVFLCGFLFISGQLPGQESVSLNLDEVMTMAHSQSREALSAKHRFRSSYWEYRTFRTQYLPMLNLNTTLPSLRRSIIKYTTLQGNDIFVEQSVANYSLEMSLSKTLGVTGGSVFLRSGLDRIDNLSDSTFSTYLSNPVTVGFSQPLLAYNPYRWDNKIEPIRYREARQRYLEDAEQVSISAINYFFDLLQAQLSLKIALTNEANYDTLFKIAQGRYNLGRIAENDLLQLELSFLKARAEVENARLSLGMNVSKLKAFLRLPEQQEVNLILPGPANTLVVDLQHAVQYARANRSDIAGFARRELEAESEVHQARLQNRFNASLYAEYGLTQSARELNEVYDNPQDGQVLAFGIQIPILDWGLARGKIKMAESNRELVRTTIEQERIAFEQEVYLKVMQFNMQQNQLMLAAKADTVAQKRYYVTKQRYLIGKIDITELNIAQTETDNAQLGYINALRNFWKSYFELRKLTLFDYLQNREIEVDFKSIYR